MTQDYQITKLSSTTSGSGVSSGVTGANGQAGTTKTFSPLLTLQTSSNSMQGLQVETDEVRAKAREKFDKLQASNGMTYGDARRTVEEIKQQYPNAITTVMQEQAQPKEIGIYIPPIPVKVVDLNKLPAEVRSQYQNAINAMIEIQQNNSALFKQTGYTSVSEEKFIKSIVEFPQYLLY